MQRSCLCGPCCLNFDPAFLQLYWIVCDVPSLFDCLHHVNSCPFAACSAGRRSPCSRRTRAGCSLPGCPLLHLQPAQVAVHTQGQRLSVGGSLRAEQCAATRDLPRLRPGAFPTAQKLHLDSSSLFAVAVQIYYSACMAGSRPWALTATAVSSEGRMVTEACTAFTRQKSCRTSRREWFYLQNQSIWDM